MKILQLVTLVSPDGAYGGPVRVALNQTRSLIELGHDVTLAAAASGFQKDLPEQFDGVPVKLFRGRKVLPGAGFGGIFAPSLLSWLARELAHADVLHVHMGRDLITLPCPSLSRLLGVPYVLQTHGMIMPSQHPFSPALDVMLTRRALEKAARVYYLTDNERRGLREVGGGAVALQRLVNGVPLTPVAATGQQRTEVLFLARLHWRKRPLVFVKMAARIHSMFPNVKFSIVGPDEGEAAAVVAAVERMGLADVVTLEGALEPSEVTRRIGQAMIYVLPSVNEPFPMTVLEAMSLGKPVVITDTCGLAEFVSEAAAGVVVDSSLESLVEGVARLLADDEHRTNAGMSGRKLAQDTFSMRPVATQLVSSYEEAIAHHVK